MIFGQSAAANEKIFVNYRRDDAGGYAGRLSDTLSGYFGSDRVFRDVTGIDYGHDFEKAIDDRLSESGALIVLIGEQWLDVTDAEGNRRLDDPNDYVTREIAIALENGMPVLPVLIGDARMPRPEDLPDRLKGLGKRNAITITDERWDHDLDRLAKVIAIDVPGSVAQRRLDRMKYMALALLLAAGTIATLGFCAALGVWDSPDGSLRAAGFPPLLSGLPFMAIPLAGALILNGQSLMAAERRKYCAAAIVVATVGTIGTFVHYAITNVEQPNWSLIVNYGVSTIVIFVMLTLMMLAGFRAK